MKNRFAKQPEETDFHFEDYLVPTQRRKTEIIETDYNIVNGGFLYEYFPELFTKDGKLKKRQSLMIVPDEK